MKGFGSALNAGIQAPAAQAGSNAGGSFGSALIGTVSKVVKGASIGATIFGGIALKSGLDRLTTIQNATTSLTTIMGDAGKAAALMGEIKKTVQGTPFNLDQFADAGKNLVAMNIAGEKVPGILTAIGNAAATSGKGAQGVQSLVDTFGKMASAGQVSLDQVWSISATGVPALQILANGFNTTTDDMKNMISEGSVPAGKAIDILTAGIMNGSDGAAGATVAFGGAMEGLRQTFTGAFGGMKAAVARFGAAVLGPFMPLMTNAFTGTGAFLDKIAAKVTPVMERASVALGSLISGLTGADYAGVGAPLDAWVAKGEKVRATLVTVKDGAVGLYDLLVKGDFTGAFSRAFSVDEDSPVVDRILTIRDGLTGLWDLLVHGDFTGAFARAFGVEEDSPIVDKLLNIRTSVMQAWDSLKSVDLSGFSSAMTSAGTAMSSVSDTISTAKDNAGTLKPALQDLGAALAGAAGGGSVILSNLLGVAVGVLRFFSEHTGLATAAILAMTASMAASGPIGDAYKLAIIVRTPLIALQTLVNWQNTRALAANTAATAANTGAQNLSTFAKARAVVFGYALAAADAVGTAATWAFTTATTALGTAFKFLFASPLGLIILGIAALVTGMVLFFTKTETGRKIITAVWEGIKAAVSAVVDWFVGTAWPFLQRVWEGIAAGATWLWQSVLQPVFAAVWGAFKVVGDVVMAVWNGFLSPVFQLIGAIVSWLWNNVLSFVFSVIQTEWQALGVVFGWVWDNVLHPVIDAIATAASWLWNSVLEPVIGWIKDRWSDLMLGMQIVWATILQPALTAIGDAFNWVWNTVISPVITALQTAWSGLMTGMKAVWDNVLAPIFGSNGLISTAVGAVKSAFDTVVDGIETTWNKIMDIAKKPVVFVVNDVINGVFIDGFNTLANAFGTTPIERIHSKALGFAEGGYTGDGGKYQPMGVVHGGEFVFTKEQTARLGRGQLEQLANSGIPGYLDGGFVPAMFQAVKNKFPDANLNSGKRDYGHDYHTRGQAIDLGRVGQAGGAGNSFLAGVKTWLYDTYGSGTAELIYDGLGSNRSDLRNAKPYTYDATTRAAHTNHVHWALDSLDVLGGGGGAPGGNAPSGSGALDFLNGLNPIEWLKNKVSSALGAFGAGTGFGDMVRGAPGYLIGKVTEAFSSLFSGGSKTAGGTGLDSWIAQAIGITGVGPSWTSGLKTLIMRESGGNPFAINETDQNAKNGDPSRGLMQTIGATFERYRDKSLINDIFDPIANIVAGINYIKSRYGDISNVQQANPNLPPKGYDNGGWLRPGRTLVENRTGKPEAVFNPQQWAQIGQLAAAPAAAGGQATPLVIEEMRVFLGDTELKDAIDVQISMRDQQNTAHAFALGIGRR